MNFGVEKTVDNLGRIVIPKSLRKYYDIELNDKIFLVPRGDGILITKLEASKTAPSEKNKK